MEEQKKRMQSKLDAMAAHNEKAVEKHQQASKKKAKEAKKDALGQAHPDCRLASKSRTRTTCHQRPDIRRRLSVSLNPISLSFFFL